MRVRVLKDFAAVGRTFRAGEVVEINPRTEGTWLRTGLVCQDKSLDGASETKVAAPSPRHKSKKKTGR